MVISENVVYKKSFSNWELLETPCKGSHLRQKDNNKHQQKQAKKQQQQSNSGIYHHNKEQQKKNKQTNNDSSSIAGELTTDSIKECYSTVAQLKQRNIINRKLPRCT